MVFQPFALQRAAVEPPVESPGVSLSPIPYAPGERQAKAVIPKMEDIVVKPAHYAKWKIEPITFIMENGFGFAVGNIIKYAARAGSKIYDGMDATQSEITDLEKVRRYAEMRINQLKGKAVL